jgi:hypothetical protein
MLVLAHLGGMMSKPDNLLALQQQGLDDASCDLYLRVLAGESLPPPSAARDRLVVLRLLKRDAGDPDHFIALDPAPTAVRIRQERTEAAIQLISSSDPLTTRLEGLAAAFSAGTRPLQTAGLEHVVGIESVSRRLSQLVEDAEHEILTAQPKGPRPPEELSQAYGRDVEFLSSSPGHTMRTLYLDTARADEGTQRWVATVTPLGAEVRTVARPFRRTIVVDRRRAVVEVVTPWEGTGEKPIRALIVHDPAMAAYLAEAFEQQWAVADPWDPSDSAAVSTEQRTVLDLLARDKGQPDIAKALSMSPRWVGKIIAELKARAGVTTVQGLTYWWAKHGG